MFKYSFLIVIGWVMLLTTTCARIASEYQSYPHTWAMPVSANHHKCRPPTGTFNNYPSKEHFQHRDTVLAPTLERVLTNKEADTPVSHLQLSLTGNQQLTIKTYTIANQLPVFVDQHVITNINNHCKEHRFQLVTEPDHTSFDDHSSEPYGYQNNPYEPSVTAAYLFGTLLMGAPISHWWDYRLMLDEEGALLVRRIRMDSGLLFLLYAQTAMDDDWFRFDAYQP